ncbi:hypothetical protein [Flavobacterium limnophilum]|uniref:hypothetical protein n=1 Tax=Flavobacterium limnophilum TaxID=3003262 RepID=UPI0022ABD36D|nr:hypothetical protein [Flavobacterium limnophilum]
MDISFQAPFHVVTRYEKIKNVEFYDQFVNWLKGEFDLCLMEELDGLTVHYPNGLFSVKLFSKNEKDLSIEIKIRSKTLKSVNEISSKIETIHRRLKKVFLKTTAINEMHLFN